MFSVQIVSPVQATKSSDYTNFDGADEDDDDDDDDEEQ